MILLTAHLAAKAPHLEKLDPASGRRVPAGQWLYQRIVRELIVPLLPLIPVVILLMLEPHMSGIVLTTAICGTILLLGGSGGIITWAGGTSAVLLLRTVLEHIDSIPYLQSRLDGWTHDLSKMTDQTLQSLYAIGSGGFLGKGFLQGTQIKYGFVPERHTDFIFCTVGEEWGFVGTMVVLALLCLLILRLMRMGERQQEPFGRIYCYCVAAILLFHVLVNVGMTIGLMPVMGIPLPFMSYGGSSLIAFTILLFIAVRLDASTRQFSLN